MTGAFFSLYLYYAICGCRKNLCKTIGKTGRLVYDRKDEKSVCTNRFQGWRRMIWLEFFMVSAWGREILEHFEDYLPKFKKIIPTDYKRMITTIGQMEEKGMSHEQATLEAFLAVSQG